MQILTGKQAKLSIDEKRSEIEVADVWHASGLSLFDTISVVRQWIKRYWSGSNNVNIFEMIGLNLICVGNGFKMFNLLGMNWFPRQNHHIDISQGRKNSKKSTGALFDLITASGTHSSVRWKKNCVTSVSADWIGVGGGTRFSRLWYHAKLTQTTNYVPNTGANMIFLRIRITRLNF